MVVVADQAPDIGAADVDGIVEFCGEAVFAVTLARSKEIRAVNIGDRPGHDDAIDFDPNLWPQVGTVRIPSPAGNSRRQDFVNESLGRTQRDAPNLEKGPDLFPVFCG
ncbi:hypothetical protein [Rhodoblastus sp.]|uniref:hypothetical protein n=1 Tax=Rhodoblastus sp. TaxID=1962975 RepID=UPI00261CB88D|nr:hypothetical protein [Rhodoblastus sp.]